MVERTVSYSLPKGVLRRVARSARDCSEIQWEIDGIVFPQEVVAALRIA